MFVQKIKRSIFNLLVLAQLVAPLPAIASSDLSGTRPSAANEMLAASGNLLVESLNRYGDKINMKWVNGGFRAESNGEYSFDLKAFSVIREYAKQVFFTQYGLSKDGDASTLNAGLGFYHLLANNIMIGGNAFYDARTGTEGILNPFGEGVHKRFSVGGTIMTSQAGMFFNVYRGLSDSIARYKVSDGYDFGINGLVPGYESVNLGVTHYNFNEETQGNKFKVEYKPNSLFTFGVEQDQSDNPSSSLYVETKYEFNKPLEEQLQSTARVSGDVWSKRYNEVERDNKISLELAVVDFTMATPTSVPHGATVYLKPLAIGGGDGELSFEEVVADDDVTVDTDAGTVTSSKVAEVDVKVTRAALGEYNEATVTVTVIFTEKIVTLVDDAEDNGLLTSEQGEDEGFGVDLTKAIVMVGTGGVSYAIKSDEEEEDESKMASSPMVNHTGKAVPASHPLGASVTEKGLVTATGVGTVGVVVSQKGDSNYEASVLDVYVTFSKSSKGIEVEVPKSVEWGKTVDLKPLISGGGEGKLSFNIKEGAENTIDANVTQDNGIVTAVSAGTIEVTVKREEDSNYEVSTQDVTVTFGRKTEDLIVKELEAYTGAAFTITGVTGAGSNETNLTYEKLETLPEDMGTVEVNLDTGDITGVVNPGVVKVTAIRKQDNKYNRVTAIVIINFVDEPEKLTIEDQEATWGEPEGFDLGALVTGGQGALSFEKSDNDAEMDAELNSDTGVIKAKEAGVLTVTVTRGGEEKEVTVTFNAQDGTIDASVPNAVIWGNPAQINVTGNGLNTLKYEMVRDSSIESADVGISSGILTADEGGVAVVNITREGNKDYNTVSETFTFTFDRKTEDLVVADLTAFAGATFTITDVTGAGSNETNLRYEKLETLPEDMGTVEVNPTTGDITGVESPGVVKVTAIRKQDDSYNRVTAIVTINFVDEPEELTIEDQETIWGKPDGFDLRALVTGGQGTFSFAKSDNDAEMDAELNSDTGVIKAKEAGVLTVTVTRGDEEKEVTVTFNAQDGTIDASVPNAVIWGNPAQINVTGNGLNTLKYEMVRDSSIESADVGISSGILTADEGGVAVVNITREGNKDYNTVSETFTFTFDRKTEELSGLTDTRESVINSKYSIVGVIGTDISDGDLSYDFKGTNPSDMGTVKVTPDTGEITGVTAPGEVTVTVTRAPNASYEQVSGDVTITYFIDGVLSITDQELLDAQIWHETDTFNLADYIDGGGELKFTGSETNNAEKDIQVTPEGMITAKVPGVFTVDVHRAKKNGYSEDDLEVTVTFGKQDSTIDVENPDVVLAGTPSQINVTGVGGQTFKYTKNTEKTKIEADVGLESGIVNSNVAGSVFVIVTHEGTEKYNLETQEVEVTFREKATVEFTIVTHDEVKSGEAVEVSGLVRMPEGVETGTLSYAIEGPNNIGAELNENTGHLTATGFGPVRIVVTREEDNDYKQSSKFIDIVFSFSGEDSKARLSLDDEVVLTETMKVNFYGDEVAGYKQIRSYDILRLQGYENYGQSWHISSSGHKDWNLQLNNQELVREQKAQIAGEAVFPNCSYGTVKQTWKGGLNVHEDYIYVKDGARCTFDVTFFRKGNYKGKTVKVDFLAADIARARSNGYMTPRVKLDDTAETRSTGTKVFRKINLASTNKLRNPDSQELIYTGSDFSFQPNGSLWEESHLTDAFLEGLEQNCVVASGNIMYLKEHSVCHGHVRFVENANYLSKLMEITVTSRQNYNTSTFGNKFKFIGSSEFPGAEEVTGVYGVNVKTAFNGSQLDNIPYTLSGPDVETREDGSAVLWNSEVIDKINNVEKCIFVRSKNSSSYNDRLLLIKKGGTCNITVNFPSTTYEPEKTEHITVTAKGLSPNPASIGNLSYTAQWEAEDDSFKYVELLDLERNNGFYIHTNNPNTIFTRNDYRYRLALGAIDYSGAQLHSDSGKPFPNGTTLDSLGKNCMIISSDSSNEGNPPVFYVKKGTSCAIDVTFPENDNYLEKTETLTLSANDD